MAEEGNPLYTAAWVDELDDFASPEDMARAMLERAKHFQVLVRSYRLGNQQLLEALGEYQNIVSRAAAEEKETLNHIEIQVLYDKVQLTLRGKKKLFAPSQVLEMINALSLAHNAALTYTPPARIGCEPGTL